MDSLVFRGYVEWLLTPTLHAGDIVVMDNLSPHNAAGVPPREPAKRSSRPSATRYARSLSTTAEDSSEDAAMPLHDNVECSSR